MIESGQWEKLSQQCAPFVQLVSTEREDNTKSVSFKIKKILSLNQLCCGINYFLKYENKSLF